MKNKVLEFCAALDAYAEENCGCEYQISASYGDSFSCNVQGGEIDRYSVNDYISVAFKVKYNGKLGSASTTALDEDGIPALVRGAKENAELIESPDEQFIFAGSPAYAHPMVYSEKLADFTPQQKIAFAKDLERRVFETDKRIVRTEYCSVETGVSTYIIKNSHGLDLCETSGFAVAYVIPIAKVGEEMNSGMGISAGFDSDALDAGQAVEKGVSEAIDFCGSASMASGSYRVIFRSSAFSDMLETFSGIFSAEAAQRGLSMLAGKEGEKVASDCLSIRDDATVDWGFGSRGFDSEGVAGQKTAVIDNGVLKTLLYNLKTAKKAGVQSTGYASGVSNFIVAPGEKTLDELYSELSDGFMITEVTGLHAGANAATGDFSLLSKGYLIENGKRTRPVSGVTVSGNFYELLKNIKAVGSDVYKNPFGAAIVTPSVLLDRPLSIAGGDAGENAEE